MTFIFDDGRYGVQVREVANLQASQRWLFWRRLCDKIVAHPDYALPEKCKSIRNRDLLMKNIRFCQKMMAIYNQQSYNTRNPNPYLP